MTDWAKGSEWYVLAGVWYVLAGVGMYWLVLVYVLVDSHQQCWHRYSHSGHSQWTGLPCSHWLRGRVGGNRVSEWIVVNFLSRRRKEKGGRGNREGLLTGQVVGDPVLVFVQLSHCAVEILILGTGTAEMLRGGGGGGGAETEGGTVHII